MKTRPRNFAGHTERQRDPVAQSVPAASCGSVPLAAGSPGGTPGELAGGDACATAQAVVAVSLLFFLSAPIAVAGPRADEQPGFLNSEFIYKTAPFPSCHASTIVETKSGLIAAWFGGTGEGLRDVGIWVSRHEQGRWTAPVEAANGVESPTNRYPTWNPVLFQPKSGPLMLFYKVGPSPSKWWGMLITSTDEGKSWSPPHRLPDGILGPIKNKPVQLANGDLLCPTSSEDAGWRVHFERTSDLGKPRPLPPPKILNAKAQRR